MKHTYKVKRDLWSICKKIREVVNFIKFNFWDYYSIYDIKNTGFVTVFKFKNALSGPLKSIIDLNDEEIQFLVSYFENSNGQVPYGQFCEIIHESGLPKNKDELNWVKNNDPQSIFIDVIIEDKIKEKGTRLYTNQNVYHPLIANKTHKKDNVLTIFRNLQKSVFENRINVGQFFQTFDPDSKGHVTETQFRRCLDMIGVSSLGKIYYPEKELFTLLLMYKDKECPERINWKQFEDEINTGIVKRGRVNLNQFLNQFDLLNHKVMSKDTLQRGLDMAGIKLDSIELEILINEFESKTHSGQVDYHRFCNIVEEAFTTLGLDQNTFLDPNEYLTSYEGVSNYLNDEQRSAVDSALKKLRSKPNIGLDDLFKDHDKHRQGIVSNQEFLNVLTVCKLNMLLSIYEDRMQTITRAKKSVQ
ncbi:uncharacterized protein LOC113552511 [Rhopalosiphum maidis]|uniref:uncharacterized protein LOC113552511 n=1 Tax=Rhopalosiphum maidis TaxID=43146 RepID=UPI000F00F7D6|nr:uncharacterized protein LOC113552511 [Rhopalosiphum maidis]